MKCTFRCEIIVRNKKIVWLTIVSKTCGTEFCGDDDFIFVAETYRARKKSGAFVSAEKVFARLAQSKS